MNVPACWREASPSAREHVLAEFQQGWLWRTLASTSGARSSTGRRADDLVERSKQLQPSSRACPTLQEGLEPRRPSRALTDDRGAVEWLTDRMIIDFVAREASSTRDTDPPDRKIVFVRATRRRGRRGGACRQQLGGQGATALCHPGRGGWEACVHRPRQPEDVSTSGNDAPTETTTFGKAHGRRGNARPPRPPAFDRREATSSSAPRHRPRVRGARDESLA